MALPKRLPAIAPLHRPSEPPVRHLAPAATPASKPRRNPIVLATIGVIALLAILGAQLGLSIAISENAYQTDNLILAEVELAREQRALEQDVEMLASPQYLSQEALKLGMVQNTQPAFLRLESSALVGDLKQQTMAPRANLIANVALSQMLHPESRDREAAPVTDADAAAGGDTQAAPAAGDTSAAAVEAAKPKPTGPIPWNGKLAAPETH